MFRKLNRAFQDYMRPKRLALGKWMWDRKEKKQVLDMKTVKSVLILRYDGKIGDMVVNTLMFREIKKSYPEIKIGVVTKGAAKAVISNNPYVDKIYDYEDKSIVQEIKKERYDLLIDFTEMLRVNQMKFINQCRARINMGLEKEGWNLFDVSYKNPKGDYHISEIYREVLKALKIKNSDLSYDIHIPEENRKKVENFLEKESLKKYVVLNPFAASKYRSLNMEKISEIIEKIQQKNWKIVIISTKEQEKTADELVNKYKIHKGIFDSILEVAELIKRSKLVVTPDTSIVHLATAFKTPTIAIYRKDRGENTNMNLWGPNSIYAEIIVADSNPKPGEEGDINAFEIKEFVEKLKKR